MLHCAVQDRDDSPYRVRADAARPRKVQASVSSCGLKLWVFARLARKNLKPPRADGPHATRLKYAALRVMLDKYMLAVLEK